MQRHTMPQPKRVLLIGSELSALATAHQKYVPEISLLCIEHQVDSTPTKVECSLEYQHMLLDVLDHKALSRALKQAKGNIDLVIFQPKTAMPQQFTTLSSTDLASHWQYAGLTAIHVAQRTLEILLKQRRGTFIFLNPPCKHDHPEAAVSTIMSAGIRALSQSLAREFQPRGLHIVNLEVEQWSTHSPEAAAAIFEICLHLYAQPKSSWTQQLTV